MNCVTVELLEAYASLFVHTWDYYAVQQADGSYRPTYQSLSLSRIADHLQGRYTLGTYMVDAQGFCSCAVFDADREDGLTQLVLLAQVLAEQGISLVLEASRRGGHGWVCFDRPVLARVVRRWLVPYAERFGMEFYPKQDTVRSGGVGSLVRLPLGVHRKSGGWYPFVVVGAGGVLVPVGETVAECCAWAWGNVERVVVGGLASVDLVAGHGAHVQAGGGMVGGNGSGGGRGAIQSWCRSVDIVEVISRYTSLDRRGVGRCPLPGHHKRGDLHPSLQVFGGEEPHWYCYTWGRAGDVFDFLRFYYGLTVQDAWKRLQDGTLPGE